MKLKHSLVRAFCNANIFLFILFSLSLSNDNFAQLSFTGSSNIDFTGFDGTGLIPIPASGELDSDDWEVTGMSDGNTTYGGNFTTGDHARGNTAGSVGTGGLYSLNSGAIWVSSTGTDMTSGTITLRATNNTGADLNVLNISYDILFLNDQDRATAVNFEYSTDGVAFTPVPALNFTSPLDLDALGIQTEAKSILLTLSSTVSNGNNFFLRWTFDDAGGSGSRDEVGIDNILFNVPPVKNENTGEFFSSIQAAIDDANTLDGHVITVAEGTYTEALLINKALTINGASQGISGTDPRPTVSTILNSTINVNASGTTIIDGFDIMRDDAVAGGMIQLSGNSTVTVRNNVIQRMGSAPGIVARGLVTSAGTGVKDIANNLFTGDPSGGLFSGHVSWNNALYINGQNSFVNITNNKIENSRTAINVDDYGPGIQISGNSIDNNGTHIALGGVTPTMGANTLGANDFINNPASTMINLSNVDVTFSLDITSSSLAGTIFSALPLLTLFEIEARMAHKEVSPSKRGKVIYVANTLYVNNFLVPFPKIDIIDNSIKYAGANDEIILQSGEYNQRVTIDKSNLTLKGENTDKTITILDGTGLGNGSGIFIANNIVGITIQDLTVRNYSGASGNTHAGIYANLGNNDLEVDNVAILDNVGGSGFYANGPVDGVTVNNCMVSGHTTGARGIVIWNGLKENITFTNNMVTNNSCCGIELQDGDADGVLIEGNTVEVTAGDSGMGLTGMMNAVVNNNDVSGVGRFGIEIKNPNGNVAVTNNMVENTGASDSRDYAGISVFRRAITPASSNPDIPQGVTVTGNTVIGYQHLGAVAEGFGIVVEGIDHIINGNTLESNDIGIQVQGGGHQNANYPAGDGGQSAGQSPNYFGRGNAPIICGVDLGANTFVGATNGIDVRLVTASVLNTDLADIMSALLLTVENKTQGSLHCTISDAIENANSGDVLEILSAEHVELEQIVVDKNLTLQGQGKTLTTLRPGFDSGSSGDDRAFILVNDGINFDLKDLTIDGSGHLIFQAIRNKGAGSVDNVRFTEIKFNESGPNYAGTAIAAFGTGPVDVTNSMFDEIGRVGVLYFGAGVSTSDFEGNMYTGKGIGDWLDYMLDISAGAIVNVTNNEVSENKGVASVDGSTSAGILVSTFFGADTEALITENEIHDNTTGIAVGFNDTDASTVVAENNNIFDNDNGITSTGPTVDAKNNYWGAADGPSGAGYGSGDSISEEVDACPFYNAPFGSGSEALVGPIQNTDTGGFFCSIQEAIDDEETAAGHTITIPAGTWSENLNVSKGVTLIGANSGTSGCDTRTDETIIEPASAGTTPITIAADGVTINGVTITNPDGNFAILNTADNDMMVMNNIITNVGNNATTGNTHSIYVSANSGPVDNITIQNNRFYDINGGEDDPAVSNGSASAILIGDSNATNDVTNLTIANNCIELVRAAIVPFVSGNLGGKGAYGILLGIGGNGGGAAINAQITGNDIQDLEGLWAHAIGLEGNTPSADVLNNKIDNLVDHKAPPDAIAVMIEDNSDVSEIVINNNSFTNLAGGIVNLMPGVVDGTCNYWDTADFAAVALKYFGAITVSPFITNGTDDSPAIGFQPVAGSCDGMFPVLNIDTDIFYASVQQGVDNALAGQTLEIQTTDFTEPAQITIDKDLTIQGKGKTMTTLRSNYNTASGGHDNDLSAWIRTEPGTNVTIQDLTLDAAGVDTYTALRFESNGEVDNVAFNEIKHSSSQYLGIAVQVQDGEVNIDSSMFTNIGRIGVHYRNGVLPGATISGTYSNNMYTGKGDGDWLDYALDISGGTMVTVENNEISNNTGVAVSDGSTSAGILVTSFFPSPANSVANDVMINDNELHGNTTGVAVGFNTGDISVVTARDNNIFDNDNGITSTGPMVDAEENYWGAADGPGGNGSGSGNGISPGVDACPFYDAPIGTGSLAACRVQNVTRGEGFFNIQDAIDDSDTQDNDLIKAAAGTYVEKIIVDKRLTIHGPFDSTPGCDPSRGTGEAVLHAPMDGDTIITILSAGTTIEGFTLDGNDVMNSTQALVALNSVVDANIRNNVITNFTNSGLASLDIPFGILFTGTLTADIRSNCISQIASQSLAGVATATGVPAFGLMLLGNTRAEIDSNQITASDVGMRLSTNSSGIIEVRDNVVSSGIPSPLTAGISIDEISGTGEIQFLGSNTITNNGFGIFIAGTQGNNDLVVTNVDLMANGFGVYGTNALVSGPSSPTTFKVEHIHIANSLGNGIYLVESTFSGSDINVTVDSTEISGTQAADDNSSAIAVFDGDAGATGEVTLNVSNTNMHDNINRGMVVAGNVAVSNSIFENNGTAAFTPGQGLNIILRPTAQDVSFVENEINGVAGMNANVRVEDGVVATFFNNSFIQGGALHQFDFFAIGSNPPRVNAGCNWWGETNDDDILSRHDGNTGNAYLDYSPFLDDGTDTDLNGATSSTLGFQGDFLSDLHVDAESAQFATGMPGNIQEGIDKLMAGNTLYVNGGMYDEQAIANKALTLQGDDDPMWDFTGVVSGKTTLLDVSADMVTVDDIMFKPDLTILHSAMIFSGVDIDNVTITNNTINPYQSTQGTHLGGYGNRNAISINYAGFRVAAGGVDNILVNGNTVTVGKLGADFFDDDAMFRSAVSVDEGSGTYTNNDFASINHDILNRFNNNGDILIQSNQFKGGGVELAEYNAGGGTVTVDDNVFDSEFAIGYTNRLRLKNNQADKTTIVTDNEFTNHSWGISLENYSDITVDGNTFTPADIPEYRHITVNTKLINSNSNTITQDEINGTIINNTFNPSASGRGGIAMAFYNHDSDNAMIGDFVVGGMGEENSFNAGIETFIRLDDLLGSTDGVFPEYNAGGGWTTTMACWDQNIIVKNNLYDVGGGLIPAPEMNAAELTDLEDLLYHQPDNICLGELVFFTASIELMLNGETAQNINNGILDASENVSIQVCDSDGNVTFSNVTGSPGNIGVVIDFNAASNLEVNGVNPLGITISATLQDFNTNFIAANQPANFRLVDPMVSGNTSATLVAFNDANKNGTFDTGECSGDTITFMITVDPTATVDEVEDQLLCPGENSTAIVFTGVVPGTVYNWTNDNISIGLGASGMGDIASFVAMNPTAQPITATITVTPVSSMGGLDCEGAEEKITITVLDGEAPELMCMDDIIASAGIDSCSTHAVYFDSPKAYDPQYFEGFENPGFEVNTPSGWNEFQSTVIRVTAPGTGPAIGSGFPYGVIDNTDPGISNTGIFSRLGGYSSTFGNGFKVRQDVYMDLTDPAVLADTYGWDLSAAANGQDGNHQRDFIFHTASNPAGNILVGGSNNTNFTRRNDIASLNHYEITTSGWYTFEFVFRDEGDGTLAVDLNLLDDSGTKLFTETRNSAADVIATEVGGNRYLWFTFIEVDYLAIDNTQRAHTLNASCDMAGGSEFFVGETTVACTATDVCGDIAECTFTVTITDGQAPQFEDCPADAVACNNDDSYTWTHPSLIDNCALMGGSMTQFSYSLSGATTKAAVDVTSFDGTTMATEIFNEGVTTVTYTAQDSSGNAVGNTCSFEVTVEIRPTVEVEYNGPSSSVTANNNGVLNEYDMTVCSGDTLTIGEAMAIGGTVDPSDCGELRVETVVTNNIPGAPSMDTTDLAIGEAWMPSEYAYENTNSDTRTVVYESTPYYDVNGNDMLDTGDRLGASLTFTLNVNPEPVGSGTTEEACSGVEYTLRLDEYITNILDIDNDDDDDNQPIIYNWEITDISPLPVIIGVTENQTGTGDITHTVINPYTIVETIEYTITPVSENGCEGEPFVVNVNINANPLTTINPNGDLGLCQGESRTVLGFVLPSETYAYNWSIVSAGSGNASLINETTLSPILTAQTDNENDITLRFVATNTVTGCSDSTDVTYTVSSVPAFEADEPMDLSTCEMVAGGLLGSFDLTQSITTVIPIDATVTYHTSATDAEAGLGAIGSPEMYTATNGEMVFIRVENNGCYITEDILLTVYPTPFITINAPSMLCINANPVILTAMPLGGTFSGPGVTGNMFDPSDAGVGMHSITYTFTSGDGCEASGMVAIEVDSEVSTVTNTNNSGPGSLRAVIANPCLGDTVFFDVALTGETITLTSGEIIIPKDLVIQGLGKTQLTLSGNNASRIFNIPMGRVVSINNLSMVNGYSETNGGAIINSGDLMIKDILLEGNNEDTTPKAMTLNPSGTLTVTGDNTINN
ncbi:MAG: right-handed parallel beta-helix repeat-containing protein [Bacteroidota bacterium]